MLPRSLPDGEDVFLPVPGGAIFNTAIALGRLGEKPLFFSGLSTDMFGEKLAAALEESGVDHSLCIRSNRPTTLAFVTLKDGHAQYAFHDEGTAGRMFGPDDLPVIPEDVNALHFGAISLISEPCGSAYEALAAREHQSRIISLDPNIRPGFVSDETGYRERLSLMIGLADIIKISDEDLAWLVPDFGSAADFEAIAGKWLAGGASLVMLTRGGDGALAHCHAGSIAVPANQSQVVDTVGAGDTFNAGLLAGLDRAGMLTKQGLREAAPEAIEGALRLATKVAGITVSRAGANPPWAHELTD